MIIVAKLVRLTRIHSTGFQATHDTATSTQDYSTMNVTERTPVLVGVGQILNRVSDLSEALEPLEMMWRATQTAARDAQIEHQLDKVQSVRVVRGMWPYRNPAQAIADRMGARDVETVGTLIGGNQNQAVINETSLEILNEGLDLVLITGAENGNSASKARRQGVSLKYTETNGQYDRVIGAEQQPEHHPFEVAKGIRRAIQVYPMYDNAIRYNRGETMDEHIARVSGLWSRFNDVAQTNPNAWVQDNMTAEEIRTPSETNRPISFPYTKFMNANMSVNMGAALIMASASQARKMGIPQDKWVYPLAGVKGYDHFSASVRDEFYTSPGIRAVARQLLGMTNTKVEDLNYVDLYSCFPSAVQVAAAEYGLSEERDLTVTGGLTFGGGPLNNYVMHSIARTVELLRETPEGKGLVTANGGNIYKHVHGLYGSEPPEKPFRFASVQQEIDAQPSRTVLETYRGDGQIEGYTVMYEGFKPAIGHVACRTPDGDRTWANTTDADVLAGMTSEEFCGRSVRLDSDGDMRVLA